MAVAKKKTATAVVRCTQMTCGKACGLHGIACYQIVEGENPARDPSCYGLPLYNILPEAFAEGALVRVTVELIRKGKLKVNPWLKGERKRKQGARS